jgi:hypothetical protein
LMCVTARVCTISTCAQVRGMVRGEADDEQRIMAFLHRSTLVGALPVPHPIVIRKYQVRCGWVCDENAVAFTIPRQANAATTAWVRNYCYGVVFSRNVSPPLFFGTNVRLFTVSVV